MSVLDRKAQKFVRGDEVVDIWKGNRGTILGPEDFKEYEDNRPDSNWELVQFANRLEPVWVGNTALNKAD